MKMHKNILVAGVALFLASCAVERLNLPVEKPVTKENAARIKKGVTTKAEVEALFGAPLDVLVFEGGERYFYKDFNLRAIHVEFGRDGVVKDIKYD